MKHYLKDIFDAYTCIDTDKKTKLHCFKGQINFETEINVKWQLDWYLSNDYETTTQQEFDEYYKKQVEILNSIVSC